MVVLTHFVLMTNSTKLLLRSESEKKEEINRNWQQLPQSFFNRYAKAMYRSEHLIYVFISQIAINPDNIEMLES